MEATPDAIFVKDLEGRYVLVNEAAARFLGKSPDEIIGKHDFNTILAIILGTVELLCLFQPKDRSANETIDPVLRAPLHGRDPAAPLLAPSRRRLLNPQPANVKALVASSVKLLGRTLGST